MAYGRGTARIAAACAIPVTVALGAWVSFHYCFGAWSPDPDIFVTVELWRGVQRHGLEFLSTWSYTQDNWLFSLIPLSSLAFQALGPQPAVAVGIGWAIFLISVAMTAWLAVRTVGWRAGLALACVLIFANFSALGGAGYLAYPISHNVSMAWMLLALILALQALEQGSWAACLGAALAVFVATVSDPWAAVALAAPLILAAGGMAAANRRAPLGRHALALALASTAALLAARTRLFGLLAFLPQSHFVLADWPTMKVNLYWGWRATAAMFNILPGAETRLARIFSVAALAALAGFALTVSLKGFRRATLGRQLVLAVAVLSIGATGVLYLAGRWAPAVGVGRFFPNLFFLGALVAAMAAAERWPAWRPPAKLAICGYAALFIASGLASAPRLWTGRASVSQTVEAKALTAFLHSRGLSYGYGVFWGTHALVAETISEGRVIIRPVSFRDGNIRRRPAETSSLWYTAADEPASPRRFLVIRDDGEECPSVQDCVDIAHREFGEPSERLSWRGAVILVWPQSVAAQIRP